MAQVNKTQRTGKGIQKGIQPPYQHEPPVRRRVTGGALPVQISMQREQGAWRECTPGQAREGGDQRRQD